MTKFTQYTLYFWVHQRALRVWCNLRLGNFLPDLFISAIVQLPLLPPPCRGMAIEQRLARQVTWSNALQFACFLLYCQQKLLFSVVSPFVRTYPHWAEVSGAGDMVKLWFWNLGWLNFINAVKYPSISKILSLPTEIVIFSCFKLRSAVASPYREEVRWAYYMVRLGFRPLVI